MFLRISSSVVLALFLLLPQLGWSEPSDPLKVLPVQDGGRIKPFDSFAKEMLFLLHDKETLEGRPAHEVVLTWLLQPSAWQNQEFIRIKNEELRKGLKLDQERKHFSPAEILSNPRLSLVMQELASKRETQEKLDPYFQSVQRLESQIGAFTAIASGRLLRLLPPQGEGDTWVSIDQFTEEEQKAFVPVSLAFLNVLRGYNFKQSQGAEASANLSEEDRAFLQDEERQEAELAAAVAGFRKFAEQRAPGLYPSDRLMQLEIHYTNFKPYNWAGLAYFLGAMLMLIFWLSGLTWTSKLAWTMMLVGFALHTYGFGLRTYLTGRPPVSNMYETVVWVSWGTVFFAMIIEAIYKFRLTLIAGGLVGTLCLIVAESAPHILDSSLQPLEPVLRSQFWLIVHVLTITISYSAFFLALGLGDLGLLYAIKGERQGSPKLKAISMGIYRSLQIGVVLLTAGIILGGIWADYSWGRFWGWDPKETWALIALLGYLAVLHGRVGGWLRDVGLCVGAVLAFSLVIMAWYGVNFVLGAGLHSYGFGAGGVEYVGSFVVLHFLYVIFALLVVRDPAARK